MSASPVQSQPKPSLSQVRTSTLQAGLRRKSTPVESQAGIVEMTPQQLASVCFDEAVIRAGLTNQGIAADLDVNESIVGRWRNVNARETPSLFYLTKLGPDFLRLLYRGFSRRCGWGKKALLDIARAVEDAAVEVE
jgi:hypothetical protein